MEYLVGTLKNELGSFTFQQTVGLVQKLFFRDAEIEEKVKNAERWLRLIENNENIIRSEYSIVYENHQKIRSLGYEFLNPSNFWKKPKLYENINDLEKNLEQFILQALVASNFQDRREMTASLETLMTLLLQLIHQNTQNSQLRFNYHQNPHLTTASWPCYLIKTEDVGVQEISRQDLGAKDIWISAHFVGTVTEPVRTVCQNGVLWAYTFLSIPGASRLIKLNINLAQLRIGNLNVYDRIAVFGKLETQPWVNENANYEPFCQQVTVTRIDSTCKELQSNIGPYLGVKTGDGPDGMQLLSKWDIGASEIFICASFEGTVTQPVNYAWTSSGVRSPWTILHVNNPQSYGVSRLLRLEGRNEEVISCMQHLHVYHLVSVSGFILPYKGRDQNGNVQIFYMVIAEKLSIL